MPSRLVDRVRSSSDAPRERRLIVSREQVSRSVINREATRIAEPCLREAATAEANGSQAGLPGCLGIVGRVADNNDFRLVDGPELGHGGLKDIRMWLGFFGVIRGGLDVYQPLNAGDLLVGSQFLGFRG